MSGIGSKLREERVRRGLGIEEVEAETRIRAKYLRALEDERFEVLPGDAYARAFLRDYAEELGLDAQQLVDELNAISAPPEELVLAPRRTAGPLRSPWEGRRRALGWALAVVVALALAVAAVLAVIGAGGGSGGGSTAASSSATHPPPSQSSSGSTAPPTPPPPAPGARPALLALAATGPCWVEVRSGSASGRVLFVGTLQAGQVRHFGLAPVWVRVGAPWDLAVRVRGHRMPLPITTAGNVLVTASGITAA
jgi:Helix-turn-helix domain/RodZ C-terminal domain